jgi:hypothetical protein
MCENDSRIWFLRANLLSISGWSKPAKFWNQELAKIWNLRRCEVLKLGICEVRGTDEDLIRKPEQAVFFA